ncbi:TetR/AcrR family transcriptional regulator [Hymenobacter terrenus]|uniref:TetR/AcrR family transcriptional regulator n=1 Tax=Hymenobacter terrenus TaxID=1629124 RepID=UPI00061908C4|nr:TetR/AcrR family transcriptional regulator [Hymenobacter terrenus]
MARPRKFEREPLLKQAQEVFWSQGYEATSVQNLVDALDIHPGTLYATFGDKHALFLEVLDYYRSWTEATIGALLRRPGSKKQAIEQFLSMMVRGLLSPTGKRGCLLTNTAIERTLCDAPAVERVSQHHTWMEGALHQALQEAQDAGELTPRSADELRALAQFLANTVQGLRVVVRTTNEPVVLHNIVRIALQALN